MTRHDRLAAYLAAVPDREPIWGVDDCSAWAAAWVTAEAGAGLRLPVYASRTEADRLIAAAGGLAPLWRSVARPAGLVECVAPELGDVGIISTSRGDAGVIFLAGGICCWRARSGAALLTPRPTSIVAAWTIPELA